ncbi:lysine transporter LysE [Methanothermobacter thermautotrophicus]|jgi:threonine/homoserine/homoserine lactone efflux protein|uniref:Lysine transporter LysE n=1 Tax=Methanothermobacter thermautotrophicus TaxID=145262 RepID=A0A842YKT5_METTF|nr:LysE family translocator [Methanothermobacter thermautotrophicus]MBE2899939.1 lysine transporter LysE [Methanothermobacter thermautotrophicus]
MTGILLFALTSFLIGLSGAMAPGPLLTVTVSDSIRRGFRAGPLLVAGHVLGEALLVVLILMGLGCILRSGAAPALLGTAGGAVLIWMGILGFRDSEDTESIPDGGSILRGAIISLANPYFFLWWGAVGAALMYRGLESAGTLGLLAFLAGHWSSDLTWYSLVSFMSSRKSFRMDGKPYKLVMRILSSFLILFGVYFIIESLKTISG